MLRDSTDLFLRIIIIIVILDRDRAMQFLCGLIISENTLDTYIYTSRYTLLLQKHLLFYFFYNGCVLSCAKALPGIAMCCLFSDK